jgi:hypothetical protein
MEQSPSWEAKQFQLVKKLPAFYGTQRFITAFTSARHLSLSSVSICASNCITQDTTTEYLLEWKATCSNEAIWCATLTMHKISAVVTVTHFKVLIHLNSLEENYWIAANQIVRSPAKDTHPCCHTDVYIEVSYTLLLSLLYNCIHCQQISTDWIAYFSLYLKV